ncbi:armadillo-type protein [Dunaliella salina]|uniref:Armadillo-type protein n=1 Tax=Dunaliella salina TaxID=3046 RepID=A0ABQ7GHP3_DUNSA|nr:armadillo-type protein [Dunaliella salina]|eukprot:KAF5834130.1 armadillo-type protein [Dunaliella salina]
MPRTVGAFKAEGISIIREYFDSSDVGEVGRRLQEFQAPGLMQVFVKQAVVASLDRKDRERELVSQLLSQLHPSVLSSDQVAAGFTRLLAAADDLVLDCPDVVHLLGLFLGRAIVDEVLPPAFLTQVLKSLHSQSLGVAIVRTCGGLLSARHGAERLSNAWHGGVLSMEQVRSQFVDVLKEFSAGAHDASEAARCLTEISAHYYHHQLVKSAIELAFENEKAEADIIELLGALSAANVITDTQMAKGFQRVRSVLGDEALDYGPRARDVFSRMVQTGTKMGWLPDLDPES